MTESELKQIEEREHLIKVVEAARVILEEGREEALDDNGKNYPWEKWLVHRDNERLLAQALAAYDEFKENKK